VNVNLGMAVAALGWGYLDLHSGKHFELGPMGQTTKHIYSQGYCLGYFEVDL
jgi:hypothetical protein